MPSPEMTAREIARETRSITKAFTAQLAGRKRGPDRRVRRNSFDRDDPRAQVFRPINGGKKLGALRWRDAMVRTAREYDLVGKGRGRRGGPLGPFSLRLLEELLSLVDFATGRLDPTYEELMKRTGYVRSTIASALRRLRAHKFLDWMRRTKVVDTPDGPGREQTSNAYFFSPSSLPDRVYRRFRDLIARAERRAAPEASRVEGAKVEPPLPAIEDRELAAIIARMAMHFDQGAE